MKYLLNPSLITGVVTGAAAWGVNGIKPLLKPIAAHIVGTTAVESGFEYQTGSDTAEAIVELGLDSIPYMVASFTPNPLARLGLMGLTAGLYADDVVPEIWQAVKHEPTGILSGLEILASNAAQTAATGAQMTYDQLKDKLETSYQWGAGILMPLRSVGLFKREQKRE